MPTTNTTRRRLLRGIGATGLAGLAPTTAAGTNGPARRKPPGRASSTVVYPLGCPSRLGGGDGGCTVQEVPVGDWIVHKIGWVESRARTCGGKTEARRRLQEFLAKQQTTALVGGEEVPNAGQYWGDITWSEEFDGWVVWWQYATPPKAKGTVNDFWWGVTFDPAHTFYRVDPDGDGEQECETYTSTREPLSVVKGRYEVTAPADPDKVDPEPL